MEPGAAPRKVWERKQDAAYDDPGIAGHAPRHRRGAAAAADAAAAGGGPIIQNGDFIYVAGVGASPEGDRPFLDQAERQDAEDASGSSARRPNRSSRSSRRSTTR